MIAEIGYEEIHRVEENVGKPQEQIIQMIEANPNITIAEMAENIEYKPSAPEY